MSFPAPAGPKAEIEAEFEAKVEAVTGDLGGAIWRAASRGEAPQLEELLSRRDVRVTDLNFMPPLDPEPPLIRAIRGPSSSCVALLLSDPLVEVNCRSQYSTTSLHLCVRYSPVAEVQRVLRLLAEHPMIDINALDQENTTILWNACYNDYHGHVRMLLACARAGAVDTRLRSAYIIGIPPSASRWRKKSAIEVTSDPGIRALIAAYEACPVTTRARLRQEFGFTFEDIAAEFACAVLLCDGYVTLRKVAATSETRFLLIVTKLPMELQMIICHRRYGAAGHTILARHTESGVKVILRNMLLDH